LPGNTYPHELPAVVCQGSGRGMTFEIFIDLSLQAEGVEHNKDNEGKDCFHFLGFDSLSNSSALRRKLDTKKVLLFCQKVFLSV
jgi:hypothetical protein